jgi:hypothetical protein
LPWAKNDDGSYSGAPVYGSMLRCAHARPRRGNVRSIRLRRANAFFKPMLSSLSLGKMGRNQLQQKRWAALSSRRQDLIDQPIVRCFERIDKSNSRQFKAILEVLGKQMANAGPLCRAP